MFHDSRKSLLEQMKISDAEIHNRLELVEFHAADAAALRSAAPLIEEHVDALVSEFYEHQLQINAISMLIGDSETLGRLKTAQHQYIQDLFCGRYDALYVNNRLRIGLVHKRIGVEPKLYLSAIRTLREILAGLIRRHGDDLQHESIIVALDKLLYFDTTLVVDTYISGMIAQLEMANRRIQDYAESLEQKVTERTLELEAMARKDALTGLLNQRSMYELARRALASAKRRKSRLTIAYFDVDKFKQINDRLGHLKGDEVLRCIGNATLESVRETDIACRYGGDEFCIVFPEADAKQAAAICQRIIDIFSQAWPDFSLSVGLREFDPSQGETSIEDLINEADGRMYRAKKVDGSFIER